jgi:hypothetical protein
LFILLFHCIANGQDNDFVVCACGQGVYCRKFTSLYFTIKKIGDGFILIKFADVDVEMMEYPVAITYRPYIADDRPRNITKNSISIQPGESICCNGTFEFFVVGFEFSKLDSISFMRN